jgi:hypothetical protein
MVCTDLLVGLVLLMLLIFLGKSRLFGFVFVCLGIINFERLTLTYVSAYHGPWLSNTKATNSIDSWLCAAHWAHFCLHIRRFRAAVLC